MWAAAGNARPVSGGKWSGVSHICLGGGALRFMVRLETFVFSLALFTVLHEYISQHFPVQSGVAQMNVCLCVIEFVSHPNFLQNNLHQQLANLGQLSLDLLRMCPCSPSTSPTIPCTGLGARGGRLPSHSPVCVCSRSFITESHVCYLCVFGQTCRGISL